MAYDPAVWPRPKDPVLAGVADAIEERGFAAEIWDFGWRLAYLSTDYRRISNAGEDLAWTDLVGTHILSPEMAAARDSWPTTATPQSADALLGQLTRYACETTPVAFARCVLSPIPAISIVLEMRQRRRPQRGAGGWKSSSAARRSATTYSPCLCAGRTALWRDS